MAADWEMQKAALGSRLRLMRSMREAAASAKPGPEYGVILGSRMTESGDQSVYRAVPASAKRI
jgi:hypothetical protein